MYVASRGKAARGNKSHTNDEESESHLNEARTQESEIMGRNSFFRFRARWVLYDAIHVMSSVG
jgi:hypothetical protein